METDLAGERFRLDPYHSTFWRKAAAGKWEPETFAVLNAHLGPDRDYLDIGAWIGPTVLYGARKARRVVALEPDPVAFRALSWNIELNVCSKYGAEHPGASHTGGATPAPRMSNVHTWHS